MGTVIYVVKQIDVASKAGSEDVICPQLGRHDAHRHSQTKD